MNDTIMLHYLWMSVSCIMWMNTFEIYHFSWKMHIGSHSLPSNKSPKQKGLGDSL